MIFRRRSHDDGFTLSELLMVVLIIAILASLVVPQFTQSRTRSLMAVARSDANSLALAVEYGLSSITTLATGGATLSYSNEVLTITNTGGSPSSVTVSARLSANSSLDQSNSANNRVRSASSYCVAVAYNGVSAYQSAQGPTTSCQNGASLVVGGTQNSSSGVGAQFTPVYLSSTTPSATWSSLGFGNGVFMASAQSSTSVHTSTDGITWTPRTITGAASATWSQPAYGNNRWVILGQGTSTGYYSADNGLTWTAASGVTAGNWSRIVWAGSRFIALDATNASTKILTSSDGITWSQANLPAAAGSGQWRGIAYGAIGATNYVQVVGDSSTGYYSTNSGTSWAATALPFSSSQDVTYGNGRFVAVTSGSPPSYSAASTDGTTWTRSSAFSGVLTPASITYGGGYFNLFFSGSSMSQYSSDGLSWTLAATACSSAYLVSAYGNGIFVSLPTGTSQTCVSLGV